MKFGEPGEIRTPGPLIKSQLRYQLRHRLIFFFKNDFSSSSTTPYNYSRNSRYLSGTVVSSHGGPGPTGELYRIGEAKSLFLNLEALVTQEI